LQNNAVPDSTAKQEHYFEQKSFDNQRHPSDMVLAAIQPFGIAFDDGSLVTSKGLKSGTPPLAGVEGSTSETTFERTQQVANDAIDAAAALGNPLEKNISIGIHSYEPNELIASKGDNHHSQNLLDLRADIQKNIAEIQNSNSPSGNKLVSITEQLGRDPIRWRSKTTGKCNQLVGEAIQVCFGDTPWDGPTPTCHAMINHFKTSSDWRPVWSADQRENNLALKEFQTFKPNQGDVVIWDNSVATHSGIIDEDRIIYYAGSRSSPTGYAKTDIKNFTGTPEAPMNYGAPTWIFRHNFADQFTK